MRVRSRRSGTKGRRAGTRRSALRIPNATMATNARNRRLEPAYKQHGVVDDVRGVVLDVEVTTGEMNEGQVILERLDATAVTTGHLIKTATADAGYAYAKVYGGLERRGIDAIIPAKAEPIRSPVPLRRFRYDAHHDVVKCPRGRFLRPGQPIAHGRFFYSRGRDCAGCDLASRCLSKGRVNKAVMVSDDAGPASARAVVGRGPAPLPAAPLALGGLPRRGKDLA